MAEEQEGDVRIPDNLTEAELLQIVRELLGEDDEMSDADLMTAYRSGMIQELCPDLAEYAKKRGSKDGGVSVKQEVTSVSSSKSSKPVESTHSKSEVKVKTEPISDADSEGEENGSRHSHKKKKKKKKKHKHKDEKREKERQEEERPKSKEKSSSSKQFNKIKKVVSSDSEEEKVKDVKVKIEKPVEKKTKIIVMSCSSDDDVLERPPTPTIIRTENIKTEVKVKTEDREKKDGSKDNVEVVGQIVKQEPKASAPPMPDLKPFSKYNKSVSKVAIKRWKPVFTKEHDRFQKKFNLMPLSIPCIDLLDMPMLFHSPNKPPNNSNSAALKSNLPLGDMELDMIRRLERDKLGWFRQQLTRQALRFLRKRGRDSPDSDPKSKKRSRIKVMSSDSSDDSNVMVPYDSKKGKPSNDSNRKGGDAKLSKADKAAEERRKRLEEIKKKAEKVSNRGTRILDWEKKDEYFNSKKVKDKAAILAKEKEKAIAEKRKRIEKLQKEKLEKQKNAPSVSFQKILAQIEAANKEEAKKPKIELKIPKLSQRQQQQPREPATEYKVQGRLGASDIAREVTRLLSSNVTVEVPVVPSQVDDLGEYTVKKIGWWLLKNEKDPADYVLFHPELHDEDESRSRHSDEFDWPSDMSSVHGCVSDPEGLAADIPPDKHKIKDPDWADDYCGEASLYAKFRKDEGNPNPNPKDLVSQDAFRSFLRLKPGTNYSKTNFEVKCFLCNEVVRGQRKFGAHIRSDTHKNNFRNFSLDKASYEEIREAVEPEKHFVAKLAEYTVNSVAPAEKAKPETTHKVGKIERVRSDSPGPIIAGKATRNVEVDEMPIPDDMSFASYEDYDISSDESLQQVKVAIRTGGKWNEDLEERWRAYKSEEAKIQEGYNNDRDFFINEPDKHPKFNDEWLIFWERRCDELEAEGKDTTDYDFRKEWLPFWLKRMQEIMKAEIEKTLYELKRRFGIDKHTLRGIYGISAEATKRTKKKKKVLLGELEEGECSSIKSTKSKSIQPIDPAPPPKPIEVYTTTSQRPPQQSQHHPQSHRSWDHKRHRPVPKRHHDRQRHRDRDREHQHQRNYSNQNNNRNHSYKSGRDKFRSERSLPYGYTEASRKSDSLSPVSSSSNGPPFPPRNGYNSMRGNNQDMYRLDDRI